MARRFLFKMIKRHLVGLKATWVPFLCSEDTDTAAEYLLLANFCRRAKVLQTGKIWLSFCGADHHPPYLGRA